MWGGDGGTLPPETCSLEMQVGLDSERWNGKVLALVVYYVLNSHPLSHSLLPPLSFPCSPCRPLSIPVDGSRVDESVLVTLGGLVFRYLLSLMS